MRAKRILIFGAPVIAFCLFGAMFRASAAPAEELVVRLAELEIDPAQLEAYKAALKEEIEISIRAEPGVLTLYAVSVKGEPNHIRIFETYRDAAAYRAHLETPHFRKYKAETQQMVKSLKLVETEPIVLGSRLR